MPGTTFDTRLLRRAVIEGGISARAGAAGRRSQFATHRIASYSYSAARARRVTGRDGGVPSRAAQGGAWPSRRPGGLPGAGLGLPGPPGLDARTRAKGEIAI